RLSDENDPSAAVARGTLARVLSDALAMLHPFTPFMTEVLWNPLNDALGRRQSMLMQSPWPDGAGLAADEEAEREMQTIQDLVHAVRQVRNLTSAGERQPLVAKIAAPNKFERDVLQAHAQTVCALAALESCEIAAKMPRPKSSAVAVAGGLEVFVALADSVDQGKLKDVLA